MPTSGKFTDIWFLQIRIGLIVVQPAKRGNGPLAALTAQIPKLTKVLPMSERKRIPELVETSLAYILATVAAWLAFLLGWLICVVASR